MVFNDKNAQTLTKKGFTLIELLIAVAILILILAWGPFTNLSTFRDYQVFQEADYLVSNLRFAQYLSLYQKNDASFGIEFSSNRYSLFERSSNGKIGFIRSHSLPGGLKISGTKQIVFQKNTGKPSWSGIIRIQETTKGGIVFHKKAININSQGNIEILK